MDISNTYVELAVFCKQCNKVVSIPEDVNIEISEYHHTARCKACNGYLKHLQQNKTIDTLPFGKYKGQAFLDVYRHDRAYIIWLGDNSKSKSIRNACENAILMVSNE